MRAIRAPDGVREGPTPNFRALVEEELHPHTPGHSGGLVDVSPVLRCLGAGLSESRPR
jgi:hypothetical protein